VDRVAWLLYLFAEGMSPVGRRGREEVELAKRWSR
jgi:hypothetical protein